MPNQDGADGLLMLGNERGSIVAYANDNGQVVQINTYDPFGRQKKWNDGIFRCTGQAWLPEIALYNYKARLYDPERIRFMQTDPIGYEADMNLYAYAYVAVKTIDDLAGAIRRGNINASDVPIQTIIRDGNELILNIRPAHALTRARIDRS